MGYYGNGEFIMNLKNKKYVLITSVRSALFISYLEEELPNNGSNVQGLIQKGNLGFIFQQIIV
jgi:hypothetical protein